ncbi:ABC transporter ATP-binding protein [Pararhodonellum marinum]|uniref:ABC transporter ATP-binding protein n=1 Tax=Pararhodonellum marinum TaxID=2755358 RepID=UPI00188E47DD|nr:ABC transporter ATP-binding protein [Pararhodonellum marinum]
MAIYQRYVYPARTAFQVFRRAISLVWKTSPVWTVLSFLLSFAQSALPFGVFYLTKLIIDRLIEGLGEASMDFSLLIAYLLGLGLLWLLEGLLNIAAQWVNDMQRLRFHDHISGIIQRQSIRLDLAYYEDPSFHDTFHRTQQEAIFRPLQVLDAVRQLVQSGLFLLFVTVFLASLNIWMVPILLLAGLPGLLAKIHIASKQYALDRQRTQLNRESWYLHEVLTGEYTARELRLFRFGKYFMDKYQEIRKVLFEDQRRLSNRKAKVEGIGQLSEVVALTGLVGWTAFKAMGGSISVGSLVMYLQAFQRGQSQLRLALSALANLYSHRLFLTYLFEFLDLEPNLKEASQPQTLAAPLQSGLSIQGLGFTYPRREQPVLKDINLEFKMGERIALVGPNGSGKSTLIKLLARFYDPSQGSILVDGIPIDQLALDEWRSRIGIVFQDFTQYAMTAAENIHISQLQEPLDEEKMEAMAQKTGAGRTIADLPYGYQSMLGHTFHNGIELSGGQWQQLALARALYADREILILDEPMSAIDPILEQEIFQHLYQRDPSKLILFVTHRLYHLQKADRIIVMDQGQVKEMGTFEDLMAKKGLFYKLFQSQRVG